MDELDARLRAARPNTTTRANIPSDRVEAALASIPERSELARVAVPAPRRASRRLPVLVTAAAVVMFLIVGTVLAWPLLRPTPAYALTPQPLHVTGSSESLKEVVTMATSQLHGTSPRVAERRSYSVGWYLHLDNLPDGSQSALISPEITTTVWDADQSGTQIVTAGQSYWADGSVRDSDAEASSAGTILFNISYPVGSFDSPAVAIPGDSFEDVRALLAAYWNPVSDHPTASDVITAVSNTFSQWTLTNQQHARILELLNDAPGAAVAGTATDRAGRDVTVITADSTSNPDYCHLLLISNATGRIVGIEDVRLHPTGTLPVGSVTSYTLWDTD